MTLETTDRDDWVEVCNENTFEMSGQRLRFAGTLGWTKRKLNG